MPDFLRAPKIRCLMPWSPLSRFAKNSFADCLEVVLSAGQEDFTISNPFRLAQDMTAYSGANTNGRMTVISLRERYE